jgi:hypothetical protein
VSLNSALLKDAIESDSLLTDLTTAVEERETSEVVAVDLSDGVSFLLILERT